VLFQFKFGTLNCEFHDLSLSHLSVAHFGVSVWHLKCTEHMGCDSGDVQCRIYVRTEGRWAKEIR
jgi:hypothetical protein